MNKPRKAVKPKAPMLVIRQMYNTDLEIKERMAVQSFAKGFATPAQYDVLLDMLNIMMLGASSCKTRSYALDYAKQVVGEALLSIRQRYERTGKLGCSGDELNILKEFVNNNIEFWKRQPGELFILACQKYYEYKLELSQRRATA